MVDFKHLETSSWTGDSSPGNNMVFVLNHREATVSTFRQVSCSCNGPFHSRKPGSWSCCRWLPPLPTSDRFYQRSWWATLRKSVGRRWHPQWQHFRSRQVAALCFVEAQPTSSLLPSFSLASQHTWKSCKAAVVENERQKNICFLWKMNLWASNNSGPQRKERPKCSWWLESMK